MWIVSFKNKKELPQFFEYDNNDKFKKGNSDNNINIMKIKNF